MSVGHHVEKFNIVSNDHGRTHKRDFSFFHRRFPFWVNLVQKNQNCQFKLKFGTWTNLNITNSTVVFIFSVLDGKHPFWVNLVKKIKIVSLNFLNNLERRTENKDKLIYWFSTSSAVLDKSVLTPPLTYWTKVLYILQPSKYVCAKLFKNLISVKINPRKM